MTFNPAIARTTTSVLHPASIMVSKDTERKHQANRVRDISWLRSFLEGENCDELAAKANLKSASTVKIAIKRVVVILYYRARDREGLTKAPDDLRQVKAKAVFWLRKLDANEDRLLVLDPNKLPA